MSGGRANYWPVRSGDPKVLLGNRPSPKSQIRPDDPQSYSSLDLSCDMPRSILRPYFRQNHWFGWVVSSSESHCLWKSSYFTVVFGREDHQDLRERERQREGEPVLQIYLRQGWRRYEAVWACGSSSVGRHGRGALSRQGTRQMHIQQS